MVDFAKAFGKVARKNVVMRLRDLGLNEYYTRYVFDFMGDRKFRAECQTWEGKVFGPWQDISSGMPQGAIWAQHMSPQQPRLVTIAGRCIP